MTTLSFEALPSSPVCRIWRPRICNTGSTFVKAARLPPAKMEMLPVAARWQPPETGQFHDEIYKDSTHEVRDQRLVEVAYREIDALLKQVAGQLATDVAKANESDTHDSQCRL